MYLHFAMFLLHLININYTVLDIMGHALLSVIT